MPIGYGRSDSFDWSPAPVLPDCETCTSFYTYARMSAQMELYLPHYGVIVLQYQEGQPTDATGYVPMDLTTGIIPPTIVDIREPDVDLDVPGRIGGRDLDFDNSLTRPGDGTYYRSAPMDAVVAAPAMVMTAASVVVVDYENVRNSDRGDDANILIELYPAEVPVTLIENLANLLAIAGTFRWSDDGGSTWTATTGTRRWDGATIFEFVIELPSTVDGEIQFECTFDAGNVVGTYTIACTMSKEDIIGNERKLFTAEDTFALTA